MGIYLNPDNYGFAESLRSEIYVDKTGLIAYTNKVLNSRQKFACISRPRRFGKTMTAEMLIAYYSCGCDSREMFQRLEIAKHPSFEDHLNQHNVLFLNMQRFLSRAGGAKDVPAYLQSIVLKDLRKAYPEIIEESVQSLSVALEDIFLETRKGFIFIIDEWDCIFREKQEDKTAQIVYLDFLRDLFKDQPYVNLVYMTGILPIKKYGTHFALNMFDEFSMTNPKRLAEYVGFTESEVQTLCTRFRAYPEINDERE